MCQFQLERERGGHFCFILPAIRWKEINYVVFQNIAIQIRSELQTVSAFKKEFHKSPIIGIQVTLSVSWPVNWSKISVDLRVIIFWINLECVVLWKVKNESGFGSQLPHFRLWLRIASQPMIDVISELYGWVVNWKFDFILKHFQKIAKCKPKII